MRSQVKGRRLLAHLLHIVSFVENHNCPLQVNAVCPATLQEGKGAGLEPRGRQGKPPQCHGHLALRTDHRAGRQLPLPAMLTQPREQVCDPTHARHTAMGRRRPKAGLGLVLTWGGLFLVFLCFNCI